jgi:hypothetical protein
VTIYRPGPRGRRVWRRREDAGPTTPDDGLANLPRDRRKALRQFLPDGTLHLQYVDRANRPAGTSGPSADTPEVLSISPPKPARRRSSPEAEDDEMAPLGLRLKTPDPWR